MSLSKSILEDAAFDGFGESEWSATAPPPTAWLALDDSPEMIRRRIRERSPAAPGVYGMIGVGRQLIYAGMSKSLRDRLCSYFVGRPTSGKMRRIATEARYVVWEQTGHELTAWLRELELIRGRSPRGEKESGMTLHRNENLRLSSQSNQPHRSWRRSHLHIPTTRRIPVGSQIVGNRK